MGAKVIRPLGCLSRFYTDWLVRLQFVRLSSQPHRFNLDGPANIGGEIELQLVQTDGTPAHGLAGTILNLLPESETRITGEVADWILELNLSVQPLTGSPLTAMHQEAQTLISVIQEHAAAYGASVVLIGSLPTTTEADIHIRHMSTVPRYGVLNDGVWKNHPPRTVNFVDRTGRPKPVRFHSIMGEGACTSVQLHVYFPGIERVPAMYNVAMATAGPLVALFGNAPNPFGSNGWKDARYLLFSEATRSLCRPGKYIDEPFETIRGAVTRRALGRKSEGPFSRQLSNLLVRIGTDWLMIDRIIPNSNKRQLRHEIRYCSALPLRDLMAFNALLIGLLANPHAEQLAHLLPEAAALSNYQVGCREGAHNQYQWPASDGHIQGTPLGTIIRELLSLSREGWHILGTDPTEVDWFLETIEQRLIGPDVVITGADWQILRTRFWEARGYRAPAAAAAMLGDYVRLMHTRPNDSISDWPSPHRDWAPAADEAEISA